MVPRVAVAVERWRWKRAVSLFDMPVGLTFGSDSMTHSAVRDEQLSPC